MVQRYSTGDDIEVHWRHLVNTIEFVHPRPRRHLEDKFWWPWPWPLGSMALTLKAADPGLVPRRHLHFAAKYHKVRFSTPTRT